MGVSNHNTGKNRQHFFGEIVDGKMILNEIGLLAEKYWLEIPNHFPFVKLGNFVVMPNHTHGVLIIDKPNGGIPNPTVVGTPKLGVPTTTETADLTNAIKPKTGGKNESWKPQTIGVIINQYKRIVTINVRKIYAEFAWQSRFHDHIIRNKQSFDNIQKYIENNPLNWGKDKFYV